MTERLIDRPLPDVDRAVVALLRVRALPVDQREPGALKSAEAAVGAALLHARTSRYQTLIDGEVYHVAIELSDPKVSVRQAKGSPRGPSQLRAKPARSGDAATDDRETP